MNSVITVAITETEYKKSIAEFEKAEESGIHCVSVPGNESELAAAIRKHGAKHAILGVEKYNGILYEALPKGGVLVRYGVGYDGIDLGKASQAGIFVTNTPGVLEESVAEHTIALILSAARHLPELNMKIKNNIWPHSLGTELRGKRLAIIGCGHIGCIVARTASVGFGMEVIGCDLQYGDVDSKKREFGFKDIVRDFSVAVSGADYVTLHIPSTPATRRFINKNRLSVIPDKAWLINTARGAVVDESPLYDALSTQKLNGAALDVFEHEPYSPAAEGKDLRTLSNVIMTPHVASSTREACGRVAERALRNIELAERREFENMDLLNPEVLLENNN